MRNVIFDKKQTKIQNLRKERLGRENVRFDDMDKHERKQEDRIVVRRDVYNASKKNKGGAAFNIITMNYETNPDGNVLARYENDA